MPFDRKESKWTASHQVLLVFMKVFEMYQHQIGRPVEKITSVEHVQKMRLLLYQYFNCFVFKTLEFINEITQGESLKWNDNNNNNRKSESIRNKAEFDNHFKC